MTTDSLPTSVEELKQKITAISARLTQYQKQVQRHKMFSTNQRALMFKQLNKGSGFEVPMPNSQLMVEFWRSL